MNVHRFLSRAAGAVLVWCCSAQAGPSAAVGASEPGTGRGRWFAIQVVDEQTGRGVPLVELETVHHLRFVTDNAGRVAFAEPGLMDQPVAIPWWSGRTLLLTT